MRYIILLFFSISLLPFIYGQEIVLISNPSFEVKKDAANAFPMGWDLSDIVNYKAATVHWNTSNRKASNGQSYITLANSDSTNQAITQLLGKNPIEAYTTYKLELDIAVIEKEKESRLQVIGIGKSITERQVLATSWPIDHREWKKSILKLCPTFDIYAIQFEVLPSENSATLAIDNLSNLSRVIGEYDCKDFLENDYSRSEIDYSIRYADDIQYEISEGKYHCVYTSFYTQKVLFDKFGIWDEIVYDDFQNERLLWNNVKLIPGSNEKFRIAATGDEDDFDIYASIIVFDSKGNDMLSVNNPLAPKIMKIIGDLIKKNKESNKKFFEYYEEEIGR